VVRAARHSVGERPVTFNLWQMETVLALLLSLIAAILFYRLVERRHKIILARALAAVFTLGLLAFAISAWRTKSAEQASAERDSAKLTRNENALVVTFLPESTRQLPREKPLYLQEQRIAFRICSTATDTIDVATITAYTWSTGHSSRQSVAFDSRRPDSVGVLTSDLVLAPKGCAVAVFDGFFRIRDSVWARADPTWRNVWDNY